MIEKNQFALWAKSGHALFEIFEGRNDAYPLSKRWMTEWLDSGDFLVSSSDVQLLSDLLIDFEYQAFRIHQATARRMDEQVRRMLAGNLTARKISNVGVAFFPFLFTWNLQRYKQYFLQGGDLDLVSHFEKLGLALEAEQSRLKEFASLHILIDEIDNDRIGEIWRIVNQTLRKLGIGQNEPVGTAKVLHMVAPNYFPLWDNSIAEAAGLKSRGTTLTLAYYIHWMNRLRKWLLAFAPECRKLEVETQLSLLKLVDEGLYVMSSISLDRRVKLLGI